MTRLEMQERIGTGPYRVVKDERPYVAFGALAVVNAHDVAIVTASTNPFAICDALNALWDAAQ